MTAYVIFLPCGFYFLLSIYLLFSAPNVSGRRLDVYHTSTHGVASVRILNAGLKCAARDSLQIQDAKNRHLNTLSYFGAFRGKVTVVLFFDITDEESFLQEISGMSVHEAVAVYISGTYACETSQ